MPALGDSLRALAVRADDADRQHSTLVAGMHSTIAAQETEIDRLRARVAELEAPPILWGATVWKKTGETDAQALTRTEKAIGPVQIVRHFSPGAPTWPTWAGMRVLHTSFKWLPRDVLAGTHDAAFRAWCDRAPDRDTYWTLWHEPEDDVAAGRFTAADYRAAWKRLAGIARASGRRLHATLTLMEWTLQPASRRNWRDYYPGADVIDVLAWDAYHGPKRAVADVYATARRVSAAEGKPWAVAETGVAADMVPDPAQRRRLLTDLARSALAEPRPRFVCYFDPPVGGNSQAWPITNDPAASAAWVAGRN